MDENAENMPNETDSDNAQSPENVQEPESTQPGEVSEEISKDARMWAMLCHLLAIFTCFVAPLIIWLLKKEDDPFIDEQGKEALNFQITVAIAIAASCVLFCLAPILLPIIAILDIIFVIIAAVKSNGGQHYRYPVCLRLIK